MTVREMIFRLEVLIREDPTVADLPVMSDGCDCVGAAVDVVDTCLPGEPLPGEPIRTLTVMRDHGR